MNIVIWSMNIVSVSELHELCYSRTYMATRRGLSKLEGAKNSEQLHALKCIVGM